MDPEQRKLEQLKQLDESRLVGRSERAAGTKVHGIISNHFFSAASSECRDVFIDGHYYGCISLAQAVAEGLARFLGDLHQVGAKNDPARRVHMLQAKGAITKPTLDAFLRIWGNDRNTFHHVNPDIPTGHTELESRAEECVNCLFKIESEVFAFDIADGKIVPKNPEYWLKSDPEHLEVFLRLNGH